MPRNPYAGQQAGMGGGYGYGGYGGEEVAGKPRWRAWCVGGLRCADPGAQLQHPDGEQGPARLQPA